LNQWPYFSLSIKEYIMLSINEAMKSENTNSFPFLYNFCSKYFCSNKYLMDYTPNQPVYFWAMGWRVKIQFLVAARDLFAMLHRIETAVSDSPSQDG
jgi:hypothetical protein